MIVFCGGIEGGDGVSCDTDRWLRVALFQLPSLLHFRLSSITFFRNQEPTIRRLRVVDQVCPTIRQT